MAYTNREAIEYFKTFGTDSTGRISDDNYWSETAILKALYEARAVLLKERIASGILPSNHMVQTLGCVELEEADRSECPCAPASGCKWLKSKKPIPAMVHKISMTSILGEDAFYFIEWDKIRHKLNSRNSSTRKRAFYTVRDTGEGTFLYVHNKDHLKLVSLSAIFEDPIEALRFPSCGDVSEKAVCFPFDTPFYTDANLRDAVMKSAWSTYPVLLGMLRTDLDNDDRAETTSATRQRTRRSTTDQTIDQ